MRPPPNDNAKPSPHGYSLAHPSDQPMRILLIESDPKDAKYLKQSLEQELFAVDVCHDGEKGSYLARTNDYDLVIVAWPLPKKSSLEVCVEIRKAGKGVPIIAVSSMPEVDVEVGLFEAGADDCVAKPFSLKKLYARIKALLRRAPHFQPGILWAGDVTLDPKAQKVLIGKREVSFSPKEYCTFELLMRHKGEILSRSVIMEHVWDGDADPFSTTLDSHIHNIRKKLGMKRSRKLIKTVIGRGYMVEG